MIQLNLKITSAVLSAALLFASPHAKGADQYDAALTHAGRPAADSARDALDHPAEMLRLAGIKPGMKVADVLAGVSFHAVQLFGHRVHRRVDFVGRLLWQRRRDPPHFSFL